MVKILKHSGQHISVTQQSSTIKWNLQWSSAKFSSRAIPFFFLDNIKQYFRTNYYVSLDAEDMDFVFSSKSLG